MLTPWQMIKLSDCNRHFRRWLRKILDTYYAHGSELLDHFSVSDARRLIRLASEIKLISRGANAEPTASQRAFGGLQLGGVKHEGRPPVDICETWYGYGPGQAMEDQRAIGTDQKRR